MADNNQLEQMKQKYASVLSTIQQQQIHCPQRPRRLLGERFRGKVVCAAKIEHALQLAGVAMVLAGVLVAVSGRTPESVYSRHKTRIIRHASAASTGKSVSKSP